MRNKTVMIILAGFASFAVGACRTGGDHREGETRATLAVFKASLSHLAAAPPDDFQPSNFRVFWQYLREHGFTHDETEWWRLDGWQRPFRLFVSADGATRGYLVNSAGSDGVHGTEDDLAVMVDFVHGADPSPGD